MVNKENVQKWVDALRSGEYEQTTGALHRTKPNGLSRVGYCCLGVVCEVSGVVGTRRVDSLDGFEIYDDESAFLPKSVKEWLGIEPSGDEVTCSDGVKRSLVGLNDDGMPFTDIADLIQKDWLG